MATDGEKKVENLGKRLKELRDQAGPNPGGGCQRHRSRGGRLFQLRKRD